MNYLDIIIEGYFNSNNRQFLTQYFVRTFKKFNKEEFIESSEFFTGCKSVITLWEKEFEKLVQQRKKELAIMLQIGNPENVKYAKEELKTILPNRVGSLTFTIHLTSITKYKVIHNLEYSELLFIRNSITEAYNQIKPNTDIKKVSPSSGQEGIRFKGEHTVDNLHEILKEYFRNKEEELLAVLKGGNVKEKLLFPSNQNRLVELFLRLKYNGFIINSKEDIKEWICDSFCYQFSRGGINEVRDFNGNTVYDLLTKSKSRGPKKEQRICMVDWLPFKSHEARREEENQENQ